MKKKILLVFFILILTGCVRIDLHEEKYDELLLNVFSSDTKYTNEVGSGYKFYVPKGVRMIENDYNNQIFIGYGTKIYMYVDITSFHYKNLLNYNINGENGIYFKKISNNDKSGFIFIDKQDDVFFVKIVYNYAKIEVYTDEYNLNNIITLSMVMLNSIDYNDAIIKNLLEDNSNNGTDITYNIDKPASASSEFSKYLEEYITQDDNVTGGEMLPDD